jgi:hypothetical protein
MTSSPASKDELHITVALQPSEGVTLANDLRLVKAALLYGDRAKLCSVQSFLVFCAQTLRRLGDRDKLHFLREVVPVVVPDDQRIRNAIDEMASAILSKHHPQKVQCVIRLREIWAQLVEQARKMADDAGGAGLSRALESGLLELHVFHRADDSEGLLQEYLAVVGDAVSSGATYPLLDAPTGQLVGSTIADGTVVMSEGGTRRAKHVAFAAYLLQRLPDFDKASVDEIIDIRKELERPLIRFRAAVLRFSEMVRSAQWEKDFAPEAEEAFRREIEPAMLDIEEALRTNKYLAELVVKLSERPLTIPAGSCLSLVVDELASLPDRWNQTWHQMLATGIGAALGAGVVAYDAFRSWKREREAIERNQLFFYYGAGERLRQ